MEHGGHISKTDECGLPWTRFAEIRDVKNHRTRAEQFGLADKHFHPGAAVLVISLEVVAIPECHRLAIGIEYFEYANIRMVNRNVFPLLECDSVELCSGVKHTILQDVVQFEVRFHLGLIEIVAGLADLLGIEIPIPWLQFEAALL